MKHLNLSFVSILISILIIAAVTLGVLFSVADYRDTALEKQLNQVKDTVMNSVVQCYALEGAYPPDLEYLQENYGLQLDTNRYLYHYDRFASNILPNVQVFANHKAGDR